MTRLAKMQESGLGWPEALLAAVAESLVLRGVAVLDGAGPSGTRPTACVGCSVFRRGSIDRGSGPVLEVRENVRVDRI